MGYETKCDVRVDDRSGTIREAAGATVLLETDELIVRGAARIRVSRQSIEQVQSRAGIVTITAPSAVVSLILGADAAAKWQKKLMEAPKQLIDKLDVKAGAVVWLLGAVDEALVAQLEDRTANVTRGRSASGCDVVFVTVETEKELDRITRAAKSIVQNGAIWVIHRKGPAGIPDTTIFGAAKALGLTYIKVARISETHTAEKLVRPRVSRT